MIAAELTAAFLGDADGAYDTKACHHTLLERQATALIPLCAGAVAWPPLADGQPHPRTEILERIAQCGRPYR